MGSNQSVGFTLLQVHLNHPKFANARIYSQNQTTKLVTKLSVEQRCFNQWQKRLSNSKLNSQFLLLPQKYFYESQQFCSSNGNVKIFYDNFPYLLKNQIIDRAGRKQYFTEQYLWYVLLAIFSAKRQFSQNKINQGIVGNITPESIFLSQKEQIKLASILSWPGQDFQMCRIASQEGKAYLAPENFVQLSLGMSYCKSTNQSQLFSIGLTMLSAGLLNNSDELYNFQSKKFNFNQAFSRINQWILTPRYSDLLKATVQLLCSFEPKDRLKISEVGEILFRCQNSIRMRKKFTIYPISPKIQKRINQNRKKNLILPPNIDDKISVRSPESQNEYCNGISNPFEVSKALMKINSQKNSVQRSQSQCASVKRLDWMGLKQDQISNIPLKKQSMSVNKDLKNSLQSSEDLLNILNYVKQIIVQKPIVIDEHRRSDDIEEQMTPQQTPPQSPIRRSVCIDQKTEVNDPFYISSPSNNPFVKVPINAYTPQMSRNILNNNFAYGKQILSKTTTNNLDPNMEAYGGNRFKVKQTQSQDPQGHSFNLESLTKSQNSIVTMYIPLEGQMNLNQSLRSSWESQDAALKRANENPGKRNKEAMNNEIPEKILERSKQTSQILMNQLSSTDKEKIQDEVISKIKNAVRPSMQQKKNVTFSDQYQEIQLTHELSHESKILQIDNIDLDCLQENGEAFFGDKLLVGYKEPNASQIVIESIKVSRHNSSDLKS